MIVPLGEERKKLHAWLQQQLRPLSETSPAILSKFVLQLLDAADKEEAEVRAECLRELGLYLGQSTVPFVDHLFQALRTGSYRELSSEPEEQNAQGIYEQGGNWDRGSDGEEERSDEYEEAGGGDTDEGVDRGGHHGSHENQEWDILYEEGTDAVGHGYSTGDGMEQDLKASSEVQEEEDPFARYDREDAEEGEAEGGHRRRASSDATASSDEEDERQGARRGTRSWKRRGVRSRSASPDRRVPPPRSRQSHRPAPAPAPPPSGSWHQGQPQRPAFERGRPSWRDGRFPPGPAGPRGSAPFPPPHPPGARVDEASGRLGREGRATHPSPWTVTGAPPHPFYPPPPPVPPLEAPFFQAPPPPGPLREGEGRGDYPPPPLPPPPRYRPSPPFPGRGPFPPPPSSFPPGGRGHRPPFPPESGRARGIGGRGGREGPGGFADGGALEPRRGARRRRGGRGEGGRPQAGPELGEGGRASRATPGPCSPALPAGRNGAGRACGSAAAPPPSPSRTGAPSSFPTCPPTLTPDVLGPHFARFGSIVDLRLEPIQGGPFQGANRAFMEFASHAQAEAAVRASGRPVGPSGGPPGG
ncbi:hypothetical protein NSK_001474 [Nannochloropsis salina CCMP1776]|uniref:RRM domain-containing protein n=2 Tax=Nannochloropsis salina CCMP1776 TaxID=1027361 RepID=A0A4D9D6U4_9STRA|nr:hypothetical protein NSK_001474 [Nannochloropsis salina CCMP1776]|eukprot:TFJ87140.1 hypothetical protein NSK_001474 [Nannochloropsis salina CCMP1776]